MSAFKSDEIFTRLNEALDTFPARERQELVKQVNGIFEFHLKNPAGDVKIWNAEVKKQGLVQPGPAPTNPDVTLYLSDDDLVSLATGELSGAKAFLSDRVVLKGPLMVAMKLDLIFRSLGMGPAPGKESELHYDGFETSYLILQIAEYLNVMTDAEKKEFVAKTRGVYLIKVKNASGQVATWTMDMKNMPPTIKKGKIDGLKADLTVECKDKDFMDLFMGKITAQKAFMTGRFKVKGAIMLGVKLDAIMKETQEKMGFFKSKL
ncbi:SCP2 sterol-binding domain-containing protein [Linnemannia elongata]|nr:SCP2 sterol-binding domain-containing protein [Linnemannia elongata]